MSDKQSIADSYKHQFRQNLANSGVCIKNITVGFSDDDVGIILIIQYTSDSVMEPDVFSEDAFLVKLPINVSAGEYLLGYPSFPILTF